MNENAEGNVRIKYRIKRPTYTQREFYEEFEEKKRPPLTFSKVKDRLKKVRLRTFGFALFPIFPDLMSFYNIHLFLMDLVTGITMAFFHLPQGMAYGALAGLRPVNGLYTSFFPVVVYCFFATSRHNSIGTFSLASLLFSDPINRISTKYFQPTVVTNATGLTDEEYAFRLDIAITLSFGVGVLQVIMALLQVGFLATYLSGPLISGFMCASAFHVVASQLSLLFGIKLPRVSGPGNIFIKFYDLFAHIKKTNLASIVICIICIAVLEVFRKFINPFCRKKFKFPVPVELLLVVLSTVISHFAGFNSRWGVAVVGEIPEGLPKPVVPSFSYFTDLVPDIFVIGIITFAINAGLAKTYATEFGYDVLDNQELLALGLSNTFASFFKCHTACGALGRTAVVVTVGMASQIASMVSSVLFVIILYFIAPYLQSLPRAVLGCIVCVALISTFKKILDLKRLWKVSKIDASIWLVSFLSTLAIDIIWGVTVGFLYSILTVVSRSQYGGRFLLAEAKDTDLYSEYKRFHGLHEVEKLKIIRYDGPVYFANVDSFQKSIYRLSGLDPVKVIRASKKRSQKLKRQQARQKLQAGRRRKQTNNELEGGSDNANANNDVEDGDEVITDGKDFEIAVVDGNNFEEPENPLKYIILDASGWIFTDTVGLRGIKEMVKNYAEVNVTIFIASLRPRLCEMFANSGVFSLLSEDCFFVSVHDAVLVARAELATAEAAAAAADAASPSPPPKLRSRKPTVEDVKALMQTDPDTTTDLSVVGTERADVS